MSNLTRMCVVLALVVLPAMADSPTVTRVWVKPDNPVRGGTVEYIVLGDFDPKTVKAALFGPGRCATGCKLQMDVAANAKTLSGRETLKEAGTFQIELRNGDGPPAKRVPFCTVAAPRITKLWTRPDPPAPGAPLEIGIVGSGFDPGSVTAVLAHPLCANKTCLNINLSTRTISYLGGSFTTSVGGRFTLALRNAADAEFATVDLFISPKLDQLNTTPSEPRARVPFQFSISGKGFWPGRTRLLRFDAKTCNKGCPLSATFTSSGESELKGRTSIPQPGSYELAVEIQGAFSNRVPLVIKPSNAVR